MPLPTPHYDKLSALLENEKLPTTERPRIEEAIYKYNIWITALENVVSDNDDTIQQMVQLFNDYKFYIDFNLIFQSTNNFLYRQKGQIKLDNTIIEEFLPHLVSKAISDLEDNFILGPRKCFSTMFFQSSLRDDHAGGGLTLKSKDQDFAIAKEFYLRTSHNSNFETYETKDSFLGYITAECKTNLDKTMFQEASATANDVHSTVKGAKYFLLCEWLDMTPVSTASTDIDEVMILRKAKRIPSSIRKRFSSTEGRREKEEEFRTFLQDNPFSVEVFTRFIEHIKKVLNDEVPLEDIVLTDGYF